MALIVVEREFREPADLGALQAREDAVSWCLEQHGVTFLHTFFGLDARRMVCLYEAPDAEAVRHTQRTAELPVRAVWSAQPLFGLERIPTLETERERRPVIVRRQFPPVGSMTDLEQMQEDASWCFESHRAELLESYVHRNLQETVCVLAAVDAESIRTANRTVGLPFESVWTASFHPAARA